MAVERLKEVYVLHHVHEFEDGQEDVKLLGVFSSEAKEVIERYKKMSGFQNFQMGFLQINISSTRQNGLKVL